MVLLTQTPAIVTALQSYADLEIDGVRTLQGTSSEPSLESPTAGSPVSHAQVLQLFHALKLKDPHSYPHLADLLRGSNVYLTPRTPKPAQSNEYKELMARLRAEQEARDYERMLTPATAPAGGKNPFARYAAPNSAKAWDLGDSSAGDAEEEPEQEARLKDVDAQISLIINILVSILACGATFFLLLRYTGWSDEIRVLVSMLGAVVVGIAELALYVGFVMRTDDAKRKEKGRKEERTIQRTWVIEGKQKADFKGLASVHTQKHGPADSTRHRKARLSSRDMKT